MTKVHNRCACIYSVMITVTVSIDSILCIVLYLKPSNPIPYLVTFSAFLGHSHPLFFYTFGTNLLVNPSAYVVTLTGGEGVVLMSQ